jgi:DivIVA domain-containing protein
MTPDDIKSQHFARRLLWGLNPEEVAAFLEDVAEAYDDTQRMNASLAARVRVLEDDVRALSAEAQLKLVTAVKENEPSALKHMELLRTAALQEVEALLHDAQARAQTLIDEAKENEAAKLREAEVQESRMLREAEQHVAEATAKAESIVAAAKEQEVALQGEIDRLTQSRLQLIDDICATLDTYHQWLATVDPRGRARARSRREAFEMSDRGSDDVSPTSTAADSGTADFQRLRTVIARDVLSDPHASQNSA